MSQSDDRNPNPNSILPPPSPHTTAHEELTTFTANQMIESQTHDASQARTPDLSLTTKPLSAPTYPGKLLSTYILWYKKKERRSGQWSVSLLCLPTDGAIIHV